MVILKRLDIFWRHCDVKVSFKINALDAIIRAKLLYGIESAQLTPSLQRRIEVFQLKGLRKILKMTVIKASVVAKVKRAKVQIFKTYWSKLNLN